MEYDTNNDLVINFDDVNGANVDELHIEIMYMYCETDGTEGLT